MTNLRKRIDDCEKFGEELEPEIEKMFWHGIGHTPMCCITLKKQNGDIFMKCGMLKKMLPESEFNNYCLHCQAYIARKLVTRRMGKKKDKELTKEDMVLISKTAGLVMGLKLVEEL